MNALPPELQPPRWLKNCFLKWQSRNYIEKIKLFIEEEQQNKPPNFAP